MIKKILPIIVLLIIPFIHFCSYDTTSSKDNEGPIVSILSPVNNSVFDEGTIVAITVDVSDNFGITKLEYIIDSELEYTINSTPYLYNWNTKGKSGSHTIKVKAFDKIGNVGESELLTILINSSQINTPPVAFFTLSTERINPGGMFGYDASACSDNEDPVEVLVVRWDWENDGIWDTEYSTQKKDATYFPSIGDYTIKMQVKDTGGLTDTTTREIRITWSSGEYGTVTDIDGNVYKTVKIGNNWWMAENLRVKHFRNGDSIPYAPNDNSPGYYTYESDSLTDIYGYLYTYDAANDIRHIAPEGWHVPDWEDLEIMRTIGGGHMKESGFIHWKEPNLGATNDIEFLALPGGYYNPISGFSEIGRSANFWPRDSRLYSGSSLANFYSLTYDSDELFWTTIKTDYGLSVRCVKD